VPRNVLGEVLCALERAHSYEEVAYDVYPLAKAPGELGMGRVGALEDPTTLGEFAKRAKEVLAAPYLLVSGEAEREVSNIAVCGGSGGSLLGAATRSGADVYLTGEMGYHDVRRAQVEGIAVVLAGHYSTEQPAMRVLEEMLAEAMPDVNITLSESAAEPLRLL